MKKKLQLPYEYPKVKTYPYFTALLAILGAHNKADEWIYNNYILLWMFKDTHFKDYWVDFKFGNEEVQEDFCKCIEKKIVLREEVFKKNTRVDELFFDYLNQGYYVLVSVDVYYINEWWSKKEKKEHFRHQICIHGYDKENKTFTVSDFMAHHEYTTIDIDTNTLLVAYENYDRYTPFEDFGKDIWLLSVNQNIDEKVDIQRIKGLITDFLNSRDTYIINHIQTENKVDRYVFGLDVFRELIKCVDEVRQNDMEYLDRRPFHLIVEFNKIMMKRMEHLIYMYPQIAKIYHDEIYQLICGLINESEELLLLDLKYNMSGKKYILDKIIAKINKMIIDEKDMLESINGCLQTISSV